MVKPIESPHRGVVVGFYGKLPARGDFVRAGLPRDFTDRWDTWLQSAIAGSRALMGESWLSAFLEAPVWHFALPPGICGERAVFGVMLPSVDKAGRYFPLTFAAIHGGGVAAAATDQAAAWLDRCEAAGRAALELDTPPEQISDMLGVPDLLESDGGSHDCLWWSEGSPRVMPTRLSLTGMPDAATYASMLATPGMQGNVVERAERIADPANATEPPIVGETKWEPKP